MFREANWQSATLESAKTRSRTTIGKARVQMLRNARLYTGIGLVPIDLAHDACARAASCASVELKLASSIQHPPIRGHNMTALPRSSPRPSQNSWLNLWHD